VNVIAGASGRANPALSALFGGSSYAAAQSTSYGQDGVGVSIGSLSVSGSVRNASNHRWRQVGYWSARGRAAVADALMYQEPEFIAAFYRDGVMTPEAHALFYAPQARSWTGHRRAAHTKRKAKCACR
jgi:hypothetical protein